MKKIIVRVACIAMFFGVLFGVNNVNAEPYYTDVEFTATNAYIRSGFKMCVKSDVFSTPYMYIWDSSYSPPQDALTPWPGEIMTEENGIYCKEYNSSSDKHYNFVIFNDNGGDQTIDLSVVNDNRDLVKSLVYVFDGSEKEGNNYKGKWVVNNTNNSALANIVAVAENLDSEEYTIDSYEAVLEALGSIVDNISEVTNDNKDQYNLGADYISRLSVNNDPLGKLDITNEGEIYQSDYLNAYNSLASALNNLEKRKDIVFNDDILNGAISSASYKDNTDDEIEIVVTPDFGYEIASLSVSKILSYDQSGNPVLGDTEDIDVTPGVDDYEYTFDYGDFKGLYINASFSAKIYNITFVVGENGEIKTIDGDNIESPVEVHYGDDYSLVIVANEGYEIDKILVNGEEHEMIDGILVIENIEGDTEVNISFKIKPEDDEKEEEDEVEEEEANIAVPDTGREQKAFQTAVASLVGCVSVGAVLGGILGFINRKKISEYLKK